MNLECPKAFDPFYDATATFTGTRRETGGTAARALKLAVPCCVIEGQLMDAPAQSGGPRLEVQYSVHVRRSDWVDHLPPRCGDAISIDGYPVLKVLDVASSQVEWLLTCHSKEAAP